MVSGGQGVGRTPASIMRGQAQDEGHDEGKGQVMVKVRSGRGSRSGRVGVRVRRGRVSRCECFGSGGTLSKLGDCLGQAGPKWEPVWGPMWEPGALARGLPLS